MPAVLPPCQACDQPTDLHLCPDCQADLRALLRFLDADLRELHTETIRQSNKTSGPGGRATTEPPLPFNPAAAEATARIHHITTTTFSLLNEPKPASWERALARLQRLVPLIAYQQWAGHLLNEARQAHDWAERIIDTPPERAYVAPCGTCANDLYAPKDATTTTCPKCGTTASIAGHYEERMNRARDQYLTKRQLRILLPDQPPLPRSTLDTWLERDKRATMSPDPYTGEPRYRFGDVLNLYDTWKIERARQTKTSAA